MGFPQLGFVVDEIAIEGGPIEHGTQITDFISIKAMRLARRFSG